MDELFIFKSAKLVQRLIHHLGCNVSIPLEFMTILYQDQNWIVRLKTKPMSQREEDDLDAYLLEIGDLCYLSGDLRQALLDLELGRSAVDAMHQYGIAVISHGQPDATEVQIFQREFVEKLNSQTYPELSV